MIEELYVKDDDGNFRPYDYTSDFVDNNIYKRTSPKKYVPIGTYADKDILREGIWAVTHQGSNHSVFSRDFLRDQLELVWCSEFDYEPFSRLATIEKAVQYVLDNLRPEDFGGMTYRKVVTTIIGKVYEFSKHCNEEI